MAKASPQLISALYRTADKLKKGAPYQWGHMGSCNCGHLAQELTRYSKAEIHQRALQSRSGDWNEQLIDYCPTSGLPLDEVITELLAAGLDIEDLKQLERLSNPAVLTRLPEEQRHLLHNRRDDVICYLKAWAGLLEENWLSQHPASVEVPKPLLKEAKTLAVA